MNRKLTRPRSKGKILPMDELKKLQDWFSRCPGSLTAFSGGVDSSLVAYLANHFLGFERSVAVISASPSLKKSELEDARRFAYENELQLRVIATEEMKNPDYFENPKNRCYFCKHSLYEELTELRGSYQGWWILNGTNSDDLGDYRPGLQAASEFQVRSPLVECGLNKEDVRRLASHFSLQCWNKPASPCLASRIPYGEKITIEKLRQVEAAESVLSEAGFRINRVRHHGDKARIEVPQDQLHILINDQDVIETRILETGFKTVEFDTEGFVSGKLNREAGIASLGSSLDTASETHL